MPEKSVKAIARMTERRLAATKDSETADMLKSSELPVDYLKMVNDVFETNFDAGLKALGKLKPSPRFESRGQIFPNEVLICVSLVHEGHLAATTVYASADYDPRASSPTIQDVLAACVDAIGTLFSDILVADDETKLDALAHESLAVFEDIPFEWAAVEVDRRKIYLKVDKANPVLEEQADDWLAKHDPDFKEIEAEEQEETEKLFVTGPSKPKLH